MAGVVIGVLFAMLIGFSRLALHAHSVSEVVAGCMLGGAASALFAGRFDKTPIAAPGRVFMALSVAACVAAASLKPAPTQRWMIGAALYVTGHDRPYIRQGWRMAPQGWKRHATAAR